MGLFLMYFFEPGIVLFFVLIGYVFYLWRTKNKDWKVLLNATAVGSIWFLLAFKMYQYNGKISLTIFGIPLFPLVAWILGLVAFYYLNQTVIKLFPKIFDKKYKKILFSLIFYSVLMVVFEGIGYNFLGIRLSSNYPGLSICNCLHAPLWMQIAYFTNGYIFIFLNEIQSK